MSSLEAVFEGIEPGGEGLSVDDVSVVTRG
jgi:hypothetical protein